MRTIWGGEANRQRAVTRVLAQPAPRCLFLRELDQQISEMGVFYVRYTSDSLDV